MINNKLKKSINHKCAATANLIGFFLFFAILLSQVVLGVMNQSYPLRNFAEAVVLIINGIIFMGAILLPFLFMFVVISTPIIAVISLPKKDTLFKTLLIDTLLSPFITLGILVLIFLLLNIILVFFK